MKIISGERVSGKTTRLLKEASLFDNSIVVVCSIDKLIHTENIMDKLGLKVKLITINQFNSGVLRGGKYKVFLDDMEFYMSFSIIVEIEMGVLTVSEHLKKE